MKQRQDSHITIEVAVALAENPSQKHADTFRPIFL